MNWRLYEALLSMAAEHEAALSAATLLARRAYAAGWNDGQNDVEFAEGLEGLASRPSVAEALDGVVTGPGTLPGA